MHELTVAESIVHAVIDAVGDAHVESVEVAVGVLSGVVPDALEFAWDVATADTALAHSGLVIDLVPVTVFCAPCTALVTPDIGFRCPSCGTIADQIRTGQELEVRSARVHDIVGTVA